MKAVEPTEGFDRISTRDCLKLSDRPLGSGCLGLTFLLFCFFRGRPSCRKRSETFITSAPLLRTTTRPDLVNRPITVASTAWRSQIFLNCFHLAFAIASVMRSWDSDIHVCHGERPGYFSGTFSISTSHPPDSRAISPTEPERPPAP